MAQLTQIRKDLPLTFYPMVERTISDSQMLALAQQVDNPLLARGDYPLEGIPGFEINTPEHVAEVLDWLMANKRWASVIERSLQCLAQDHQGRKLLTAFVAPEAFEELAKDADEAGLMPGLVSAVEAWCSLGTTRIYFDGYKATVLEQSATLA